MTLRERFRALDEKLESFPRWVRHVTPWIAMLAVLAFLQGPALWAHIQRAADPNVLNDDARILIPPFQRYTDSSLFPNDKVIDYYLGSLPDGYRLLYVAAAKLWNPVGMSKFLPYALLAIVVGALAAAAHKLAGRAAAFGVIALTLGSEVFLSRMCGGLPRSFAFPLIACAAAALVYGRPWLLAILVCLGAATYPVTAAIIGLSLGGLLLVLPASHRGDAKRWSLKKRVVFLAATAFTAGLLLLPMSIRLRDWGAQIKPAAFTEYPEAGPGGRFFAEDRPPFPPFFDAAPAVLRQTVVGTGDSLLAAAPKWLPRKKDDPTLTGALTFLLLLSLVAYGRLAWKSIEARRLLLLGAAAYLGHAVAQPITPSFFLPQRYVMYTVPILGLLILCTSFAGLWSNSDNPKHKQLVFIPVLAGNLIIVALLGGRGSSSVGLNIVNRPEERAMHEVITKLPKDVLLAGWPSTMDSIPYATNRSVLVSFETSMAFHTEFTKMMRVRTNAVIDAYLATSSEPVRRLRDEFGVTHIVLRPSHLRNRPPGYFQPFQSRVRDAFSQAKGKEFELERLSAQATIFAKGDLVLLDLSRMQ